MRRARPTMNQTMVLCLLWRGRETRLAVVGVGRSGLSEQIGD